jgi:hypothetical protein
VPRAPGCLPLSKGKGAYFRCCGASDMLWEDWLRSIGAFLLLLSGIQASHFSVALLPLFQLHLRRRLVL